MATQTTAARSRLGAPAGGVARLTGAAHGLWGFARRKPLGAIGLMMVLAFAVIAIFGPWIAPQEPNKIHPRDLFHAPQWTHGYILGADNLGRDQLSRLIIGARMSFIITVTAVAIGHSTGWVIGLVSGYYSGWPDTIIQRFVDMKLAIPGLVLALAIVAVLGQDARNIIIALAVLGLGGGARVTRSVVLSTRAMEYVQAARAIGASDKRIIFRHVAPQTLAPLIVLVTAGLGATILAESSLAFLGLGTPAPNPSWGNMLSGPTLQYIERAPWNAVFPGVALSLVVFGFNLLGDSLRDVLDPRLRR